ncbi:MAG: hypothetical protein IPM92_11855 [Saprospiraceae bacterium]|nr:hypothetical protein [Saprospiraceae bacterium]
MKNSHFSFMVSVKGTLISIGTRQILLLLLFAFQISAVVCQEEPYYPCTPPVIDDSDLEHGIPTLCSQYGSYSNYVSLGVDKISDFNPTNNELSGYINIDRDLLIDVNNFKFINAIIMIEPGVSITVDESITFKIENSKLFACDQLWEGIILTGNSKIQTSTNTIIEDAQGAIQTINHQCYMDIQNTTFNRNRIGIYMEAPANALIKPNAYITAFRRNAFTCTGPLNGTTNEITTAGIKLNRFPITLPNGSILFRSGFKRLKYGIWQINIGKRNRMNLRNLKFDDIKIAGIRAENGDVDLLNCEFLNNNRNVSIQNVYWLNINWCNFTLNNNLSTQYFQYISLGYNSIVTTVHKSNSYVNIENCDFKDECGTAGSRFISLNDKDYINDFSNFLDGDVEDNVLVNVRHNEFRQSSTGVSTRCIYFYGNYPESSLIGFYDNDYFIGSGTGLFEAINSQGKKSNFFVSDNVVQYTSTPVNNIDNLFTFSGDYNIKFTFSENIVAPWVGNPDCLTSPLPLNRIITPFSIENAMNSIICGNQAYDCFRTFLISGICDHALFSSNISRYGTLLELSGSFSSQRASWIGNQDWTGNQFIPLCGGGWTAGICGYQDYAIFSLFNVHQNRPSTYYPTYLTPEIIPQTNIHWWTYVNHAVNNCNSPGFQLSPMDELVLSDSISEMITNPTYLYNIQYTYYKTFKRNLDNLTYPSAVNSYVSDIESNTNMDVWYDIEFEYNRLYYTSSTDSSTIKELLNNLETLTVSLDSNYQDALSIDDDSLKIISDSIYFIMDTLNSISILLNEENIERISDLYSEVINVSTSNDNELYMKRVYSASMFYRLNGFITEEMADDLFEVANSCPSDFGYLPYFANNLLPHCLRDTSIQDNECETTSPLILPTGQHEINQYISNLNKSLINLDGKLIKNFKHEHQLFNDRSIKPGLYFIKTGNNVEKYFHN